METCLLACTAALEMQNAMLDFSASGVKLALHSGVAAGRLEEVHFGGHLDRWEYVVCGTPVAEMGKCVEAAKVGQVVVTRGVEAIVAEYCEAEGVPPGAVWTLTSPDGGSYDGFRLVVRALRWRGMRGLSGRSNSCACAELQRRPRAQRGVP